MQFESFHWLRHVFVTLLGEKLHQNTRSLRNFCLWGCKAAAVSLIWNNFFFVLCGKNFDFAEDVHGC